MQMAIAGALKHDYRKCCSLILLLLLVAISVCMQAILIISSLNAQWTQCALCDITFKYVQANACS